MLFKFYIVFIFFCYFTIILFFHVGGSQYKKVKAANVRKCSKNKQPKFLFITHCVFKLLAILVFFYAVIPMTKDLVSISQSNYKEITGIVTNSDNKWYGQTVTINNKKIIYFYLTPNALTEDRIYRIKYLPHSRFGINVEKLQE